MEPAFEPRAPDKQHRSPQVCAAPHPRTFLLWPSSNLRAGLIFTGNFGLAWTYDNGEKVKYLLESLNLITQLTTADKEVLPPALAQHIGSFADVVINEATAYSFDRSALSLASDLRVSSPKRLQDLLHSVLREPQTYFFEAKGIDRNELLVPLGTFIPQEVLLGEGVADRVGLLVRVLEPGLAVFSMCWNFPPAHEDTITARKLFKEARKLSKKVSKAKLRDKALFELCRLNVSCFDGLIDVRSPVDFLSTDELWDRYKKRDKEIVTNLDDIFGRDLFTIDNADHAQKLRWITWIRNTNKLWSAQISKTGARRVVEIAQSNLHYSYELQQREPIMLDGEMLNIAALLAILAANDGGAVERQNQVIRPSKRKHMQVRSTETESETEELSIQIVQMNIGDAALRRSSSETRSDTGAIKRAGKSRVRHFVRRHLFLARNGKVVYRRGHWRGDGDENLPLLRSVHG